MMQETDEEVKNIRRPKNVTKSSCPRIRNCGTEVYSDELNIRYICIRHPGFFLGVLGTMIKCSITPLVR